VDSGGEGLQRLEDCGVVVLPRFPVPIGPKEVFPLEVNFVPKHRVASFSEDLNLKYVNQVHKMLTVSGQCIGYEVVLETDALAFGTVCLGSSRTLRMQLGNTGELVTRYRWDKQSFGPHIR